MWPFSSSSSNPDSSDPSSSSSSPAGPSPSRQAREQCWESRDIFFQCLNVKQVDIPTQYKPKGEGSCPTERAAYEKDCARSWVEYFNKRRVLEIRQRLTLERAEKEREEKARAAAVAAGGR